MPDRIAIPAESRDAANSAALSTLIFVSISFGLAFGVYDLLLPLFWKSRGISFPTMGTIFAVAAAIVFVLRIYAGQLSDVFGRKLFYTISLAVSCVANLATPIFPNLLAQNALKTSREAATTVRDTMHSTLLYERDAPGFMRSLGITRGAEYACHGFGSLAAGILAALATTSAGQTDYRVPFAFSAGLVLAATVAFAFFYKELPSAGAAIPVRASMTLREIFKPRLPRKLWLLVAFAFAFETGLWATHCYIMPIYMKQLLASAIQLTPAKEILGVAVILMFHRLTSGVPMMLIAPRLRRNLKGLFITFVFFEGVALAATPLIGNAWLAIGVWLTHDLLGAGIWSPIHQAYIQKYSRPESRGSDVSKVLALGQLGSIVGPILATVLLTAGYPMGAPFLVGGVIVALSAIILLRL